MGICGDVLVHLDMNLIKVKGIVKKEGYVKILRENINQSAAKLFHHFVFQVVLGWCHGQQPKTYITPGEEMPLHNT